MPGSYQLINHDKDVAASIKTAQNIALAADGMKAYVVTFSALSEASVGVAAKATNPGSTPNAPATLWLELFQDGV